MKSHFVPRRKKIGEILVGKGFITADQLTDFLRTQKESSKPLGQLLLEEEILSPEELTTIIGEQLGIPHIWLRKGMIDPRIVHVLPKETALHFQVIPMFRVNSVLTLATSDPHAFFVFDEVSKITGLEVQPVLCRADDIIDAIHECYQKEVSIDDVMARMDESEIELVSTGFEKEISEIAEMAEGSPVVNWTNMVLLRAIRDGASDIHIEPQAGKFQVRLRIDGVLYELMSPKLEMHPAVVSRLKVMANLDIAERRIPLDGRIQVQVEGRKVDLRFSSMPGIHGEKVVLRILDKSKAMLDLNTLGFDPAVLERFKLLLKKPHGLIVVCGPTGSGKTTTLYSAITLLNASDKNLVTIEDPVEYQLDRINQNQVKPAIGLTFAKFLKHALRQDPDIIMVGEIRDRETAEIITRLLEMGIEPYLISSSLLASLAQRLVRTICPECKTDYFPPKEVLQELGCDGDKQIRLSRGKGCSDCYDSGFKGRTGIYEIFEMDTGLQSLILTNPTIDILQEYLRKNGQGTLNSLGYKKVL
ncbi:MAG: Flp pilus assembly complex ATPase component TadA, partial [Deltaproteobacteria bacterium]|nr:Flp pilus assembly complex ATPase component TadA [Deltaproteobacteria bacterium]